MKLFFLLFLIFISSIVSTVHAEDKWIAKDKALHVTVSFTIGALIHRYIDKNINCTEDESRALTFLSTLGIGAVKESFDDEFSWKDMGANAVGAGVAASIEF